MMICLAGLLACGSNPEDTHGVNAVPEKTIEQVLRENTEQLMAISGVVGTAQGKCSGKPCIYVFVAESSVARVEQVPSEIDGYQVQIRATGSFQAPPP